MPILMTICFHLLKGLLMQTAKHRKTVESESTGQVSLEL